MRTFRMSSGLHASALSDGEGLLVISEDVGTHNTVDKIMGEWLLRKIEPRGKVLLTTGRISSKCLLRFQEMVFPFSYPGTLQLKMLWLCQRLPE
ncbi:MAG: formate dehydrogenase accessory sulfurtransferase FdhD [Archaeoglobaceae archaeon]